MAYTQDKTKNPLTEPGKNLPGTETDMEANGLYPNAVEQTYYEAGGARQKGEPRGTDYRAGS